MSSTDSDGSPRSPSRTPMALCNTTPLPKDRPPCRGLRASSLEAAGFVSPSMPVPIWACLTTRQILRFRACKRRRTIGIGHQIAGPRAAPAGLNGTTPANVAIGGTITGRCGLRPPAAMAPAAAHIPGTVSLPAAMSVAALARLRATAGMARRRRIGAGAPAPTAELRPTAVVLIFLAGSEPMFLTSRFSYSRRCQETLSAGFRAHSTTGV